MLVRQRESFRRIFHNLIFDAVDLINQLLHEFEERPFVSLMVVFHAIEESMNQLFLINMLQYDSILLLAICEELTTFFFLFHLVVSLEILLDSLV